MVNEYTWAFTNRHGGPTLSRALWPLWSCQYCWPLPPSWSHFFSFFLFHCTLPCLMGHFSSSSTWVLNAGHPCWKQYVFWKDSLWRPYHVHLVHPTIPITGICVPETLMCTSVWHFWSARPFFPLWPAVPIVWLDKSQASLTRGLASLLPSSSMDTWHKRSQWDAPQDFG